MIISLRTKRIPFPSD